MSEDLFIFVLIYKPGETMQCAALFSHGTQVAMFIGPSSFLNYFLQSFHDIGVPCSLQVCLFIIYSQKWS